MNRRRKRKCSGCGEGFHPSPQNRHKQRYCAKTECRRASTKASQAKWLKKEPDYFRGAGHVERVRRWRREHQGYWRKESGGLAAGTLQENRIAQAADVQLDEGILRRFALQENWFSQPFLVLGLISQLTGSALQEDIATAALGLQKRGREILGMKPGILTTTKTRDVNEKEDNRSEAPAAHARAVQLGRPPPDPSEAPERLRRSQLGLVPVADHGG